MAEFNAYLDLIDLSEIKDFCMAHGSNQRFERGDVFLLEGDIPQSLGYVESGYFKYTVRTSNESESVVGFSLSDDYIGDINASLFGAKSEASIIAGRRSLVKVISMAEFIDFATSKGLRFCIGIEAALFRTFHGRYLDLHRLSAAEHYAKVLERWPRLFQTIPLREIASYLGITPIHLSRLRKEQHSK
ncbi:MAG: Crp/Fnr family transcriptional regulator [Muribaculaceae bacterium]|jgi:CRP-like cAMP-binding protein